MDENDTARRLHRLRARPTMASKKDTFLEECLIEASEHFTDYTHRADPGEDVDGLILDMALYRINQLGIEGATEAKDGDLSRKYAEDYPSAIKSRMKRYRAVIGLNGA